MIATKTKTTQETQVPKPDPYTGPQLTEAEYAELGRAFAMTMGVMSFLGHRSGAELGRYCERPGTELQDIALDAFITSNLGQAGQDARDRVEEFVLRRGVDRLVVDVIAQANDATAA